ncbi:cation:dicarboxylate symporter family transporter, partial [Pandoraea pneumonica]
LQIVRIVMEVTPFGVCALIANAVATSGAVVFVNIGWLALCVLFAALVQMLIVHAGLIALVARLPVGRFFRGIIDALA